MKKITQQSTNHKSLHFLAWFVVCWSCWSALCDSALVFDGSKGHDGGARVCGVLLLWLLAWGKSLTLGF